LRVGAGEEDKNLTASPTTSLVLRVERHGGIGKQKETGQDRRSKLSHHCNEAKQLIKSQPSLLGQDEQQLWLNK